MEKKCSKKELIKVKITCVPDPQKLELALEFLSNDFRNRFEFIKKSKSKNNDLTNKTTSR